MVSKNNHVYRPYPCHASTYNLVWLEVLAGADHHVGAFSHLHIDVDTDTRGSHMNAFVDAFEPPN